MTRTFQGSIAAAQRLAHLVPGGAHTYAKGPDQYPADCPLVIERGRGAHVWDVDGNEYVEYGAGLRSVILGHAHPRVDEAVSAALRQGLNFVRPSRLELAAAEDFLAAVPTMEMVKFAKNGSDVTTAAAKLARAATGRDLVAICRDQPFFSTDDWFIGTTPMAAGVPESTRELTVSFPYGDLESLRAMFARYRDRVAAILLEVEAGASTAPPGYLQSLIDLAHEHGTLVIFDEMITGLRWALGGAHSLHGVVPDLCTFGKALGNGYSVSALAGRREIMELGGLNTDADRVFLLSTTHGGESTGLAAMRATLQVHREEEVAARLMAIGGRLRAAVEEVVAEAGLSDYVQVRGRDCNLVYVTLDGQGQPSQPFRTLFMRQFIHHGVVGPSFVVNTALTDADIEATAAAVRAALPVYAAALETGDPTPYLGGASVKPVFRAKA
ncbi:glutamate-1-semialdehyde 2,1-aminomutase [Kineosphaera limosa]|uniref:Putative aminotransferase n=1 Tax=Kineosphaera limosa NBRC 100340 TaxID=1184609 RepID=K6X5D5_9MICO|nr:glutamate-1-semialdehyde 2,1-aminomutase [Kineosphaera limosa]NYE02162.1 glutamate-1-semialdehyde 2,1-aminomutase [Kineosphaera limosa]GAB94014.1 putative aminotransferase [Kineosphaera limosa NBRC 100340]